jgi:hypothetical protein
LRLIEVSDKRNAIYLLPIGDLHLGSPQSDLAKFEGYLTWAKKEKAYIFLMGDLFDVATTQGPTSPFECSMPLRDCKHYLRDRLMPVKHLILGGIIGNHEQRLIRFANEDLIEDLCDTLEVPYAHFSAVLRLNVGHSTVNGHAGGKTEASRVHYVGYCHHTRGGGGTPGGKINRVAKLSGIFEGADFLVGAHNHMQAGAPIDKYHLHVSAAGKCSLSADKLFLVDSGSFVRWEDSYAEEQGLDPTHCGCPRIRLDGVRKDIHVSE